MPVFEERHQEPVIAITEKFLIVYYIRNIAAHVCMTNCFVHNQAVESLRQEPGDCKSQDSQKGDGRSETLVERGEHGEKNYCIVCFIGICTQSRYCLR